MSFLTTTRAVKTLLEWARGLLMWKGQGPNCLATIIAHTGRNQMSAADIQFFFAMREQIKIYHWQTSLYARHKATDDVLGALDESIDKYVEVYMGKYGRPRMTGKTSVIHVKNMGEKEAVTFVKKCIRTLIEVVPKGLGPEDTDLVNIRDEMLAELNQLLYLFTLQ